MDMLAMPGSEELTAVFISLKVALLCALCSFPLSLFFGWLLARKDFRGKSLLDALIHLPLVMPPVTVGYLLLLVLGIRGLIGGYLYEWFGIRLAFNFYAAVIASIVVSLPLFVRSVRLSFELAEPGFEDAARTLGAGKVRTFILITLPLTLPGILSGFILSFARSLGEFGATMTVAGNIEGQTRTLPLAIYSFMNVPGGEGAAMRLAGLSVLLSLGAFAVSEYLSARCRRRRADAS